MLKITIVVAILGLIGTLGGTFGGIFVTHHLSKTDVLERRQTEQTLKAYSEVLHEMFPDKDGKKNVYLPVVLYGDTEVLRSIADLEKKALDYGGDLQVKEVKEAAMATSRAMRLHVIGSGVVSDETSADIERLMFEP